MNWITNTIHKDLLHQIHRLSILLKNWLSLPDFEENSRRTIKYMKMLFDHQFLIVNGLKLIFLWFSQSHCIRILTNAPWIVEPTRTVANRNLEMFWVNAHQSMRIVDKHYFSYSKPFYTPFLLLAWHANGNDGLQV